MMKDGWGFGTRSVHAGEALDPTTGAFGVPVYQNTTYAFRSYDELAAARAGLAPHFYYTREGSPTTRTLEVKLANLEGTETAVVAASGMAAISATLLHLAPAGGHLVASADLYPLSRTLIADTLTSHGATVTFADFTDPAAVAAALTADTRALFTEVFSNPLLCVAALDEIAALAHARGIPLVVDNTFLSPALLRPAEHGADLVVHSATKYLSGHGNVLGGVVCGRRELVGPIARTLSQLGGALSPFNAWVLLAGVKTLPLRVERHCATADRLARFLAGQPDVAAVHYPGLPADPGHERARRLTGGRYGGMIAFRLRGGEAALRAFLNALELCTIAVSLGECGTLIWPFEEGECGAAPAEPLLRLSVGIEEAADLEADLAASLAAIGRTN
jgi:cystathionine beta-lyase/cystathionine gamma-synthase